MTSHATTAIRLEEIQRRGVDAGAIVLSEAKAMGKLVGDARESGRISSAVQFLIMRALEEGADVQAVLNGITDAAGWALAMTPAASRFENSMAMTGDALAAADRYSALRDVPTIEGGNA